MKLKTLAKKASRLPEIDFDWAGIEQVHEEVFEKDMEICKRDEGKIKPSNKSNL